MDILYRDDALIVVDKPANLPVHKNDFMPHDAPYLTKLIGQLTERRVYNVHRLDSKTSGVIVLAFSPEVAHGLTLQFERKEVEKRYLAVVLGDVGKEGVFDAKVVVKKKARIKKSAITRYRRLQTVYTGIAHKEYEDAPVSLVEITPETGRWHQIRQHFAQHRHDIVGDTHHGDFTFNKIIAAETGIRRLFLYASRLAFTHPVTQERAVFEAPVPDDFSRLLSQFS